MYNVTDAFKEQLKRSHTMLTDVFIANSDGEIIYEDLKINGGSVSVDKEAKNRRRCTLDISDVGNLTPKDANDLLHPLSNNEIHVFRGLYIDKEDREEYVPLGVFDLEDNSIEESGESLDIKIKGFDRSKKVERARWTQPYEVVSGTNYATAILQLINDRVPGLVYNFMETEHTTPRMVLGTGGWSGGGDPWEDARKMAESIGAEVFFDSNGICILRPEPDPITDPVVWNYETGPESTLLFVSRGLTREEVYNHVIFVGNNSNLFAPIRAEAIDNDPESPTYIDGPFGDVPTFFNSTNIFSQQQAQDAADAKLRAVLGTPENARFISVVNPAHHVGDVVTITSERTGMTQSRHVLDKLNIPLTREGSLNATCREKRVSSAL